MTTSDRSVGSFFVVYRKAWEYLGNATLGASALLFSYVMIVDFVAKHRTSSLYVALFEAAVVFFAVTRPMPKESNRSLYDWIIALLGSYEILLLRPAPVVHDHFLLLAVQLIGMAVSLVGLLSLNKSFGLVAANRGVKTAGLYGLIRHPIYAGYFLSFGAFVIQNPTPVNVGIYVLFVIVELLRIAAEERVLLRDPVYAGYASKTPWRVLPWIY